MRAKEFILETTGDKKFDNMLRKIVDPTPSTAGNVWHKDLVYQLSRALPQNLFSDQILDPEDIRYYLGDNPLVDKFESLPIEEQDIVITAISNYFFEKNGSATGSKSNISSIHPSTNRIIGNISQKSSLLLVTDYNIGEKTFDLQINNKPYRIRVDDLVSYGNTAPYPDDWFIISGPTDNEAELDDYITSINNGQGLSEFLFTWDEKHNILSKMFPDIN